MKILLTAFDPFGGEKINPALEAVNQIPNKLGETEIIKLCVPTVFGKSIKMVETAIETCHPNAVLCVGQAGGRKAITLERIAINLEDASIPDNEGNQPTDELVICGGPNAYFTTLPVKKIVSAIKDAGIPAELSLSAGTFVCNSLMFGVLDFLGKSYPDVPGGFMHVPYIPSQVRPGSDVPSMPLTDIIKGIEIAIQCLE